MSNNIKNFPLYKLLYDNIKNIKITNKDKQLFIIFVNENEIVHEIIYTIIRLYELKNNKKKLSDIYNVPYKGKEKLVNTINNDSNNMNLSPRGKRQNLSHNELYDYTFNLNNFPLQLQKMLIHFMNINKS